ncbi:hypothetical protein GSI_14839 [Ganoderma sinense ZZ0214-1]|uniref:Uncharacterized protein n=1 Tax=Ganoderma sinense ZZ0214-1 TaxID=1077348 RepID=A0A2G8RPU6_9APHY|nr:hypothetical protein GSI_14839 [Ganoderma sinense ZZ0214-1]
MSTHPHDGAEPSQRELLHRLQTLDDMLRASDEANERLRRIADRRRIPPVPDMRFEYSYLRSVRQYVQLERPSASEKGKEKAADVGDGEEQEGEQEQGQEEGQLGTREIMQVQWGRILWITTRDQVISPLLQGALWGVAGHYLRPLGAVLGAHIRAWWAQGATRKDAPEGNGAQWLRSAIGGILTPTAATSSLHGR